MAATGLAMVLIAIRRGRRALNTAQDQLTDGTLQAQVSQAHEIRLRSAWLIILGTSLSMFGGYLVWLVIGAQ